MRFKNFKIKAASAAIATVMALSMFSFGMRGLRADSTIDDFVKRCYTVAFQREPDSDGFDYWKKEVTDGKLCGSVMVYKFMFSEEYLRQDTDDKTFVKDLYTMFMGREPDQEGYDFWLGKINEGWTRPNVFAGFANSDEFFGICTDSGITAGYFTDLYPFDSVNNVNLFVERLYKTCLGRLGDKSGQNYWVEGLLKGELTGISCAANYINSPEYISLDFVNENYVRNLYTAFMGRAADDAGLAYWVGQMENGLGREAVFAGFAFSQEFTDICAAYGITPGTFEIRKTIVGDDGTEYYYNDEGRLIGTARKGAGGKIKSKTTLEYDGNGRLIKETIEEKNTIVNEYERDENGGIVKKTSLFNGKLQSVSEKFVNGYPRKVATYENGKFVDCKEEVLSEDGGRIIKVIHYDVNGNPTSYEETETDDETGAVKTIGYDKNGDVITVSTNDKNGVTTDHYKDGKVWNTIFESADGKTIVNTNYKDDGSIDWITETVVEKFDNGDIKSETVTKKDGAGKQTDKSVKIYDEAGRLVSEENYNANGDLVDKNVKKFDENGNMILEEKYGENGLLLSRRQIVYIDGKQTADKESIYDVFNNLIKLIDHGNGWTEIYTYDEKGTLTDEETVETKTGALIHKKKYTAEKTVSDYYKGDVVTMHVEEAVDLSWNTTVLYSDDGTLLNTTYNTTEQLEDGKRADTRVEYDAEDKFDSKIRTIYNADGREIAFEKYSSEDHMEKETLYELNGEGGINFETVKEYYLNGNVRTETMTDYVTKKVMQIIENNEAGLIITQTEYADDDSYVYTEYTRNESGEITLVTVSNYDAANNLVSQQTFDKDGNPV